MLYVCVDIFYRYYLPTAKILGSFTDNHLEKKSFIKMEIKYCAFLRGVNVNGTNMKMTEVVLVFENTGMKNVTSVLASGNIIFTTDKKNSELREILEKALSKHFSYDAFLFVKPLNEIENIISNNLFEENNEFHTYIFIHESGFENTLMDEFNKGIKLQDEKAEITNNCFYWKVKKGASLDGDFSKILGKKQFKDKFTSRNINTLHKILNKMQ